MPARILLIEDNPANLYLMSYLLTAFGYSPLSARDGAEGLEAARSQHLDLIICDVQLPTLDGYEVARRLKADPALKAVPLVAVTAFAMVGDRDNALAAGFDGYLPKPINPQTFVQQMQAYLRPEHRTPAPTPGHVVNFVPPKVADRHTILVVDDLAINLDLARSIFEPHGYRVLTANTAAEGMTLARQIPCDLILSDVCMAEGTGYDFILQVKADPQLRAIPFVFITATMVEDKDRAYGLSLGAARYLRRPIEPDALLAEIEACLSQKGTV
jgi:two-component system cell cycle response regulator